MSSIHISGSRKNGITFTAKGIKGSSCSKALEQVIAGKITSRKKTAEYHQQETTSQKEKQ